MHGRSRVKQGISTLHAPFQANKPILKAVFCSKIIQGKREKGAKEKKRKQDKEDSLSHGRS